MGNITTLNMTTLDGGNVIIKRGGGAAPTPPSGGESASTIEYLDVSGLSAEINALLSQVSYIVKFNIQGQKAILAPWTFEWAGIDIMNSVPADAILIIPTVIMFNPLTREPFNVKDYIIEQISEDVYINLPRLTKEEFYSLD